MKMKHGLNIRQDGALDFVSLGALIHRFDPGIVPFRKAAHCDIHVSGGEFNAAANLSDCFNLKTGIATAMSDYPIGDLIAERDRAMGVKPFYKHFKHDGVRWFHSGGIFAALSLTTAELIIEAMQAAKDAGVITSFDLNYRAKLWNSVGGNDRAVSELARIVKNVDVLVGNEEDLQLGLGIPGPKVAAKSKLDPAGFFGMMKSVHKKYPQVKAVATTLREVYTTNHHGWGAVAWVNGKTFSSPTCDLDVIDRVGGGDGFAAGFFYGLLNGESPQDAVNLGWAHGALLTTFPGDTTMATLEQVRAFADGGSARIQR